MSTRRLSCLLQIALLTVACGSAEPPPGTEETAATGDHHTAVPWFDGSVDEAFAVAARDNRPVFLYWGAVWCPPCHYLKAKVFTRPEVAARLASFVPVYLDGDTERAQILGERFATQGYPTVIVFSPDGREVARIDNLLPVDLYLSALDSALAVARPIGEVVAAVDRLGAAAAPAEDLRLLAFHSWAQDPGDDAGRASRFERLWRDTPADLPVERTRFLSLTLQSLADDGGEGAPPLADPRRGELRNALEELLATPSLCRANLELLLYGAADTIELLGPPGDPARQGLVARWRQALQTLGDDESAAVDDRLTALDTELGLATLDGAAVSPELADRVRQRVAWAAGAVADESELQAVLSTMASLLSDAGLAGEAEQLLRDKLDETVAPWYYTSFLASLRHEAGDDREAVALYRQAWQSAQGGASRFRWGSIYLRRAMELAGDDEAQIRADLDAAVGELLAQPDAFAGGNWTRLEQLGEAVESWVGDLPSRHGVLETLRRRVGESCQARSAEAAAQHERCAGFLSA